MQDESFLSSIVSQPQPKEGVANRIAHRLAAARLMMIQKVGRPSPIELTVLLLIALRNGFFDNMELYKITECCNIVQTLLADIDSNHNVIHKIKALQSFVDIDDDLINEVQKIVSDAYGMTAPRP